MIARAQAGSRDALGELARRHYARIYHVALGIVRDPADAEDVAQDVLIIVLRKLREFRGQSALSTWLTTVTMHAAINAVRRRKKKCVSLEQIQEEQPGELTFALLELNAEASPEQRCADKQVRKLIASGLETLPPHYRKPLELRLAHDLSVEEISDRLKIPKGTVKVHLFRGRKAMRQHIAQRLRPAA